MKNFNKKKLHLAKFIDSFIRFLFSRFIVSEPLPVNPKKILICDLHLIGDIVLLTGFIARLTEKYPNATISILCGKWGIDILRYSGAKRIEFLIFNAPWVRKSSIFSYIKEFLNLYRSLRNKNFDVAIEIRGDMRSNYLLKLLTTSKIIGFGFGGGEWLLDFIVKVDDCAIHILDYHSLLLNALPPSEKKYSKNDLKPKLINNNNQQHESKKYIALHFGASLMLRRFGKLKSMELLNTLLLNTDFNIHIYESPELKPLIEFITKSLDQNFLQRVHFISTDLNGLVNDISGANKFFGMDSGPAHIAAALGVDSYIFFGPANSSFCNPLGDNVKIIELADDKVPCRPCDQHNCIARQKHFCLEGINFNEIL